MTQTKSLDAINEITVNGNRIGDTAAFAALAENNCINPYKTINQQEFDGDWTGLSIGTYGFDRWRKGVTAVTIEQPVINTTIHGGSYVLSWTGGGTGEIQQSAATVISGTSPLIATLADQVEAILVVPEAATGVAFYASDIELPVRRKTKEETKRECLSYFERIKGSLSGSYSTFVVLGAISTTTAYGELCFVKKIRTPSITYGTALSDFRFRTSLLDPTSISFLYPTDDNSKCEIRAESTGLTTGHALPFQIKTATTAYIDINSELY